jgi:hypothetical protein
MNLKRGKVNLVHAFRGLVMAGAIASEPVVSRASWWEKVVEEVHVPHG